MQINFYPTFHQTYSRLVALQTSVRGGGRVRGEECERRRVKGEGGG